MPSSRHRSVAPSAARLTESLRDIGYDFPSAVADLIDNSVMAGAECIDVVIRFDGANTTVLICDDGLGMSANGLVEALRFGSRRTYDSSDLGRYGLGLKTASLSQCRSLTVVSRRVSGGTTSARELNLDTIIEWDDWLITAPSKDRVREAEALLGENSGTVVVWRNLDRVLPERSPEGGWARRRIETLAKKTADHLAMVFHRFLEGAAERRLTITVNGEKLAPWNPFAPEEEHTQRLGLQSFEVTLGETVGQVRLDRYILPAKERFSTAARFEELSGPLKWNRQQGLYIYRGDRLVQWGGWAGIRGIDEHLKLARAALDFDTELDDLFQINVAKMRVSVPGQIKQLLERPINDLCIAANQVYRDHSGRGRRDDQLSGSLGGGQLPGTTGLALRSAALQAGEYEALKRIASRLETVAPDVWRALGFAAS
ncbi:ATP-binding protein [Blastococcus sp. TF02-09]|uniref:ATP-binding protein n=1 Tax=Blastococcus sp. TF02-09 TaxID=2250576 RepID=UPI000DEB5F7F|nr:ATP-binding protein [Blastococcus sp. TF02-9]RBY76279.1 ATP-binding protein [Blastococcus sp. TF02-9]